MASAISGNSSSQELWSPSVSWAIIVLTVRFVLSVGFSCGQNGAVYWISTPIVWKYSFKMRLVNWVPLSQTNFRGMPTQPSIRSRNAFWAWAAVAFRNGINSTHLENMSWNTRSMVFPRPDRGSGPTKSAHKTSNGSLVMRANILPAAFVWAVLNFWHDSQRWT